MNNAQNNQVADSIHFTRIERILDYIHSNIDQPLTVELLAKKSCWSRWQLQRIFLQETQQTVAQYVREIKLSLAAEQLLLSKDRVMDIALNCGFNSEVSFTRSFKQVFHCSPSAYRKRGQRMGLKTPLISAMPVHKAYEIKKRLLQIRFDHADSFYFYGVNGQIQGLFSNQPDYSEIVPTIWQKMLDVTDVDTSSKDTFIGVVDTRFSNKNSPMPYWAGYKVTYEEANNLAAENILYVPEQTYAVIPHTGLATHLDLTLKWFLSTWLPQSDYQAIEGFDLEVYQADFDIHSDDSAMEFWIPIQAK